MVIVWRPLEHISALSSKTETDRESVSGVKCQAIRELPFGGIATAQWLTTRSRVRMYKTARHTSRPTDRATFSLCSHNSKMLRSILVIQKLFKCPLDGLGQDIVHTVGLSCPIWPQYTTRQKDRAIGIGEIAT